MKSRVLSIVLGIRPDVIRAALILDRLREQTDIETVLIWSGQHYSRNLKDVFFEELGVAPPQIDLGCTGETDAEIASSVIDRLYRAFTEINPMGVVFLGDTNTTLGAIAAAQLNIPIVHIEGCMRSYDWRMPEEKYRSLVDHLSDVIYTYFAEYKQQGIREGLNPDRIVVVGNPIVDVLDYVYFSRKRRFEELASATFFSDRGLRKKGYFLSTCHRRENLDARSLRAIMDLWATARLPVYFPASYRTQRVLCQFGWTLPSNVIAVDPIGYEEMLCLAVNSRGILSDSGTLIEEACVLNVPAVQMRAATERPQVYDAGGAVKFDPGNPCDFPVSKVLAKLENLYGKCWEHKLGDGRASHRIATDLAERSRSGRLSGHKPADYHVPITRAYQADGLSC
jgi:UDP-N-acetylglucosamine 2-epimerase